MNGETSGHVIRRARQEARLTQAELAAELRVHKNTVADWEKDKYFPDRHFHALNKILHISLTMPGTSSAPEPPHDGLAEALGQDTADRIRRELGKRGEVGAALLREFEDEFRKPAAGQSGSHESRAASLAPPSPRSARPCPCPAPRRRPSTALPGPSPLSPQPLRR